METKVNSIVLNKITISIASTKVDINDLFVDGRSFQNLLKTEYKNLFSTGRFKEPFILYLEKELKNIYHSPANFIKPGIPDINSTKISPLYGCADGCCVYVYLQIKHIQNYIYWEKIGRNTNFISNSSQKNKKPIKWITDFKPIIFDKGRYTKITQKLN